MAPPRKLAVAAAILAFAAAFLLWIAVHSALAIFQASRAGAWPTVPGRITHSGITKGCGRGESFYPVVRYTYSVAGITYQGSRVTFGNVGCGSEGLAETLANEWPVGKDVQVYVDPAAPSEAIITTRVHEETKVGLVLTGGLGLVIAGCAVVVFVQMWSNSTMERTRAESSARRSL